MLKGFCYSQKKRQEKKQQKRWKKSIKNIIKCKAKLYETYELLSKRILHKLYATHKHTQNRMQKRKKNCVAPVKIEE